MDRSTPGHPAGGKSPDAGGGISGRGKNPFEKISRFKWMINMNLMDTLSNFSGGASYGG